MLLKITCGTDIIEINRIKNTIGKTPSFLNRIYTKQEQEYCFDKKGGRFHSLAARFAAKEAVSKALGTGMGANARPIEIEVVNNSAGKPYIVLKGATEKYFKSISAENIDISLSHGRNYAVAFAVIMYKEAKDE